MEQVRLYFGLTKICLVSLLAVAILLLCLGEGCPLHWMAKLLVLLNSKKSCSLQTNAHFLQQSRFFFAGPGTRFSVFAVAVVVTAAVDAAAAVAAADFVVADASTEGSADFVFLPNQTLEGMRTIALGQKADLCRK